MRAGEKKPANEESPDNEIVKIFFGMRPPAGPTEPQMDMRRKEGGALEGESLLQLCAGRGLINELLCVDAGDDEGVGGGEG